MEPVLPLELDLGGARGMLRRRLHQQLRQAILDGRLPAGTTLPSTRELAGTLGVARNTVLAAYDLLVAEGCLEVRAGARPTVAQLAQQRRPRRHAPLPSAAACIAAPWRDARLQPHPARALPPRSFRLGIPESQSFPHTLWRRVCLQALRASAADRFAYPTPQGQPELRAGIAAHVGFARAVACEPDDVVVTAGAQHAFALLARVLVTPGVTRVAVEDPGYPPLRAALLAAGARLVPVPVDEEGLRVDALPGDVRLVVVTPSHQSPTGAVLSLRRRLALLDFARRQDARIIEDDYDGEFRFDGSAVDALQTLDREQRVFYVGTFSKSLFPALRTGFVVAPAWARPALLAAKWSSGGDADPFTQVALARFIGEGHLARHVRRMRAIYAPRRAALLHALQTDLSPWLEPVPGAVGLHLCARLRRPSQQARVLSAVLATAPGAQSLAEYAMHPASCVAGVVFGYGCIEVEAIGPALRCAAQRLARALRPVLPDTP